MATFSTIKNYYRGKQNKRAKWKNVYLAAIPINGLHDIQADTKEEAEKIAKSKALEDIDYNNCDCDTGYPIVYCCLEEEL